MPEDIASDPIIKFRAKDLFMEINRKLDMLAELSHKKADKTDLDKLDEKVTDMQRRGSDGAQKALEEAELLKRRVDVLERDTATTLAVKDNQERLEDIGRQQRYQWLSILISVLMGLAALIAKLR